MLWKQYKNNIKTIISFGSMLDALNETLIYNEYYLVDVTTFINDLMVSHWKPSD